MRTRYLALLALVAVLYFAWPYRSNLPDGQALVRGLRQQVQAAHFYFQTDPQSPLERDRFHMNTAVVTGENQPVAGLRLTAHCSSNVGQERTVVLREKTPGRYEAETSLDNAGHWQIELVGEKGSWRQRERFELEVLPASSSARSDDDDE